MVKKRINEILNEGSSYVMVKDGSKKYCIDRRVNSDSFEEQMWKLKEAFVETEPTLERHRGRREVNPDAVENLTDQSLIANSLLLTFLNS